MDLNLTGKSVLITGASKGIGEATAEVFAREGVSTLHLTARSSDLLEALKARIESAHDCVVHTHSLDLTDVTRRDDLIASTIDVDILVNNAGAIPSGSLEVVDDDAWRHGWELKVFGYVNMCRRFYKHMVERGHGIIINNIEMVRPRTRDAQLNSLVGSFCSEVRRRSDWLIIGVAQQLLVPE